MILEKNEHYTLASSTVQAIFASSSPVDKESAFDVANMPGKVV
jgi:hypothetical protein